ncbi:MAG: hypothetical protein FIA99_03320 [Ruminiclostridium sp.]|nr:hypothetical protein [Ruminiclostridium sp.]
MIDLINEGNPDIIYHRENREGYRFPIKVTLSGKYYAGLEKTMAKTHGLNKLIDDIVKLLYRGSNDIKQYDPLFSRLKKKYPMKEISNALHIMLLDGLIIVTFKNKRPNKGFYWYPQFMSLDSRIVSDLIATASTDDSEKLKQDWLKNQAQAILEKHTDNQLAAKLLQSIESCVLLLGDGKQVFESKSWVRYWSVILALAYSLDLRASGNHEHLRVVSARIWDNSKILERYKKDIVSVANMSLENLHLTLLPDLVYFFGNIEFEVNGFICSGLSGYPVVLANQTVHKIDLTSSQIKGILIIENFAVFIEILKRKYYDYQNILVIWGQGYLNKPTNRFFKRVLTFKPVPVYVWSDLDADGLYIAKNIIDISEKCGAVGQPILMTEDELKFSLGGFIGAHPNKISNSQTIKELFGKVADRIENGESLEQESLLKYYDIIESRLP